MNVLFVCVQNAGRSQIAEALFERGAGGRHHAQSAGTKPAARVHPEVANALSELGVDVTHRVPRALGRKDADWADVVVTMGCGDACPVVPGTCYVDWQLDDPAGRPAAEVRVIRDEVADRVEALLAELDGPG